MASVVAYVAELKASGKTFRAVASNGMEAAVAVAKGFKLYVGQDLAFSGSDNALVEYLGKNYRLVIEQLRLGECYIGGEPIGVTVPVS